MQVVEGCPHVPVDGRVVEPVVRGPARHLGIEILEGLVQLITGVLGPVRSKAGYARILFEQVPHVGGDVSPDRLAGKAACVRHAVRELPVRPSRPVLVHQSRRRRATQLQVDLEPSVQRRVDEPFDQVTVGFRQFIGFAGLVRGIGIVRQTRPVTRCAPHPERTPAPQRPIEEAGTAAGVAGRLEGTDAFIGRRGHCGIHRNSRGARPVHQVIQYGFHPLVQDEVRQDGDAQQSLFIHQSPVCGRSSFSRRTPYNRRTPWTRRTPFSRRTPWIRVAPR